MDISHFVMDGGKGSFLRAQYICMHLVFPLHCTQSPAPVNARNALDILANEGPLDIQANFKEAPKDQEQDLSQKTQEEFIMRSEVKRSPLHV